MKRSLILSVIGRRALAVRGEGYFKSSLLFALERIAISAPFPLATGRFYSRAKVLANDAAWELAA